MPGDLLPGASTELTRQLRARVDEAAAAWPDLAIAPERFARYLAARVAGEADPAEALGALHVADLYLACACVDGDARAMAVFDRDYLGQLPKLLARVRADRGAVDEVRQRLATRLLVAGDGQPPRLDRYGGRGPLATWLRVVATRALSNLRRSRDGRAAVEDQAADGLDVVAVADPELALIRQRFGVDLHEALAAAFASLEPRERNLLRMHFVDRLTIDGLAPIFGVSRATAARHLAAAREALSERTVTNLCARLRLSARELASLIGKVRSTLDLSLSAVLR
jgi:RNA polymerase sigma-70 factor (ECF subfamily)